MSARDSEAARARAEANFAKKEEARAEAAVVMAGVEAKREAEQAKTLRLRALRLAKEAEDKAAADNAPKKTRRKAK